MKQFSAKDPDEIRPLTFDFVDGLTGAEVITGTPIMEVVVVAGVDPSPQNILLGNPTLGNPATEVYQRVQSGLIGVDYAIRCEATTSLGNILVVAGMLPVRNAHAM